jgi:copper chaperone CopZ
MQQITFEVSGMHCGACENRIQRALSRLEGVKRASADHKAGVVRVALDPTRTTPEAARQCIEQAGYSIAEGTS